MVPMRDGVRLKTLVYHPPGSEPKWPALLLRIPYNQPQFEAQARRLAAAGYVALMQFCRGRMGSEGSFVFYWGEGPDGFDTVEWIHEQPWSNGRVGMWGPSYMGSVQWLTAAERTPLTAIAPTASAANFYYNVYLGGAYMLPHARTGFSIDLFGTPPPGIGSSPEWAQWYFRLPLTRWGEFLGYSPPWQVAMITHYRPDGFWKRADVTDDFPRMDVPAQHIVGYYDFMCRESVRNFQMMRAHAATREARANQQLILGPWDHGTGHPKVGKLDFGSRAALDVLGENLQWFDRFLKGQGGRAADFPPVRYFSMGENAWHTATQWPPAEARLTEFYLRSAGHANTRKGDGRLETRAPEEAEPADSFASDPADPVPAAGAHYRDVWGPVDLQAGQDRPDVLVYSTTPLDRPLRFAGPLVAEIHGSTDTLDADWVVKLIDVHPDGSCYPLATGVRRGSARDSELDRSPLEPGKIYRLMVDLGHAAATLPPGHALRVQVAGSNFPIYDRNLHTFEGPSGSRMLVAHENVWHEPAHASRVLLPVIEPGP
jgi:predicted acyl esterase